MKSNLALVLKEHAQTIELIKRVTQACEDVKGEDVVVLDLRTLSDYSDYLIVVSGHSDRHVQGITNRITDELCGVGVKPLSVEGYGESRWVLVDCGDVVINVMYSAERSAYDLEGLWMRARRVDPTALAA